MSKSIRVVQVLFASLLVICGYVIWDLTNYEEQNVEHVAYTVIIEPIEVEEVEVPDIPEEIANKPAQEPKWGFDFDYICRVVAAESRGEPYDGQVAVAQCIWSTALKRGLDPVDVVNMPNRYADPVSEELVTESVKEACRNVFLGIESATEEDIEYFYSTKDGFYSEWHENTLEHVITIGNHKFFKEK